MVFSYSLCSMDVVFVNAFSGLLLHVALALIFFVCCVNVVCVLNVFIGW